MRKPALPRGEQTALADLVRWGHRLEKPCLGRWAERHFTGPGATHLDALVPALLRIRDRHGQLIRFRPNRAQQKFATQRTERNIILKARQVGMTTYIAARFFLATLLRPGTVTLQVAHSLESAQQIFRIVRRFWDHLHASMRRAVRATRSNVRELAFAGLDSRYIVDTAGNHNAGRGLTIHNLHASEVALWPGDPRETMAGLLAAVRPGGAVEVESTPHGVGDFFHTEWTRSTADRESDIFTPHFFPWWIEAEYSLPLVRDERLQLNEEEQFLVKQEGLTPGQVKFRRSLHNTYGDLAPQEFAENAVGCFLASGRPVFDAAAVDARVSQLTPVPLEVSNNGAQLVWLLPEPGRNYVIGADVAEGRERGDFSAAVVVDLETGLQCAELLARWPIHRFAQELAELGHRYNSALVAVERNNQGHAVLYALERELLYPRLYRHPEGGGTGRPGWIMNAKTKPQAIGVLSKMLRESPDAFRSVRLLEQCRSYAYGDDNEMGARPGAHDDLVIAMAIALAVRAQAGDPQLVALEV